MNLCLLTKIFSSSPTYSVSEKLISFHNLITWPIQMISDLNSMCRNNSNSMFKHHFFQRKAFLCLKKNHKTLNIEFRVILRMMLKFENISTKTGQVITLQNDINYSKTPCISYILIPISHVCDSKPVQSIQLL